MDYVPSFRTLGMVQLGGWVRGTFEKLFLCARVATCTVYRGIIRNVQIMGPNLGLECFLGPLGPWQASGIGFESPTREQNAETVQPIGRV